MTANDDIITQTNPTGLTNKNMNWYLFRQVLDENINLTVPLNTAQQLDEEVELLNTNIQKAAWDSTLLTYGKLKHRTNKPPPKVNELVKKKRRARAIWQRARTAENKRILNSYCNELKLLIKKVKNEGIGKFLSNLTAKKDTDYSLWKCTKWLKRQKTQTPPIRHTDET